MAAKISGEFQVEENLFPFTAIAFGRIGGQNIGAKLSTETESTENPNFSTIADKNSKIQNCSVPYVNLNVT